MSYIDKTGQGNTLLILTDAESRLIRQTLTNWEKERGRTAPTEANALDAFSRGIARGTTKMAEESKADWKARKT